MLLCTRLLCLGRLLCTPLLYSSDAPLLYAAPPLAPLGAGRAGAGGGGEVPARVPAAGDPATPPPAAGASPAAFAAPPTDTRSWAPGVSLRSADGDVRLPPANRRQAPSRRQAPGVGPQTAEGNVRQPSAIRRQSPS